MSTEEIKNNENISDNNTNETNTEDVNQTEANAETVNVASKPDSSEVDVAETKDKEHYDSVVSKLEQIKASNETIEVEAIAIATGGLRVVYDNVPLFLPKSHYSLIKNFDPKLLKDSVGKKFTVKIQEIKELSNGKVVIVSRRDLIKDEVFSKLNVDDIVEGKISSITDFGVFVDLGGIEGLIHISSLSHHHVKNPKDEYKVGDKVKAQVIKINKEKNKVSLSKKAIEDSPWKGVEEKYSIDSVVKGKVKRITDFGAYIEIEPGVEGLLRINEISWTKRINSPKDVINEGQEIDVKILSISEEKNQVALSYKKALENPWIQIPEKYPLNSSVKGTVVDLNPKGALIRIDDYVDGFMPKSKMLPLIPKGSNDNPFKEGDEIEVKIADIVVNNESLILAPVLTDEQEKALKQRIANQKEQKNRPQAPRQNKAKSMDTGAVTTPSSFSFGDLLNTSDLENLKDVK